jgi:glycosyltransferase involved in cell wall biosynthesis
MNVPSTPPAVRRPVDPLLSVVAPAYEEAAVIGAFVTALQSQLDTMGLRWEVIVVDDGSRDGTAAIALAAGRSSAVRVVRLSRNFGKEAALSAGLSIARGDAVIAMDCDFQHPMASLPEFVARWHDGFDMVYGVPAGPLAEPWFKRTLRWLFHRYVGRDDRVALPMGAGDFRLLDRKAVDALARFQERERMMKGLFALLGFRQIGVPYAQAERAAGRSNFGLRRVARLATTGLTSFSALPLQAFGVAGAVVSVVAFLYAGWIVFERVVYGMNVDGFATLAAGMLFFGGLQMLSVAVLGAYVSRIYREVKGRPLFIVERIDEAGPPPGLAARGLLADAPDRVVPSP